MLCVIVLLLQTKVSLLYHIKLPNLPRGLARGGVKNVLCHVSAYPAPSIFVDSYRLPTQ